MFSPNFLFPPDHVLSFLVSLSCIFHKKLLQFHKHVPHPFIIWLGDGWPLHSFKSAGWTFPLPVNGNCCRHLHLPVTQQIKHSSVCVRPMFQHTAALAVSWTSSLRDCSGPRLGLCSWSEMGEVLPPDSGQMVQSLEQMLTARAHSLSLGQLQYPAPHSEIEAWPSVALTWQPSLTWLELHSLTQASATGLPWVV